ncbi:hypothetical protein WMY93_033385 [Mugilogobius chulae]|uniref:MAM domain-containing protein n=1 Tax=Mugilogobius chulae TaxID=88201 RepID=A0AAW0MKW5_9GOBI
MAPASEKSSFQRKRSGRTEHIPPDLRTGRIATEQLPPRGLQLKTQRQRSRLLSPTVSADSGPLCLVFSYQLCGDAGGHLNVLLRTTSRRRRCCGRSPTTRDRCGRGTAPSCPDRPKTSR